MTALRSARLVFPPLGRAVCGAVLSLLAGVALGQGSATIAWTPPTQHTDGSPLTDLTTYRAYYGTTPSSLGSTLTIPAPATSAVVSSLAPGTWYFALTALDAASHESAFSNIASKVIPAAPLLPPTAPTGFSMTFAPSPSVSVTLVPVPPDPASADEYFVTIVGAGSVSFAISGGTCIDWIIDGAKPGGNQQGSTPVGTAVTTTPVLGVFNNDSNCAPAVAVQGPVAGARLDFDGPAFNGGTVTVAGVTKPLVKSGTTWSATFP